MSSPVSPPPDEIDSDPAPVWDAFGVSWSWDPTTKNYVCDDPQFTGPPVNSPGAIPADRQPFYGHPPTEFEQALQEEQ